VSDANKFVLISKRPEMSIYSQTAQILMSIIYKLCVPLD